MDDSILFRYPVKNNMYENYIELFFMYQLKHSKVFWVRFDLRYPDDIKAPQDNTNIQKFIAYVVKYFKRKKLDPIYFWSRDQKHSINPHYHCSLMVNGNLTQSANYLYNIITETWLRTIGATEPALVHRCLEENGKPCGQMIRRGEEISAWTLGKISYLCKPDDKGQPKDGVRDFGMSRISTAIPKRLPASLAI